MDIFSLYQDFSIPHYTQGFKQCRPGWVNIDCPFCTGNPGPHLSYHIANNYYVCWRCGSHPIPKVISELLHIPYKEADILAESYGKVSFSKPDQGKVTIRKKSFKFPSNAGELQKQHKQYLEKRKFDPEYLEKEWGLLGTGPISTLPIGEGATKKELSYKHRIIIPFEWNGKVVSFDSRDISGKALTKYQACPLERETVPHKEILFGKQSAWKNTGICVEGPFDVFRFGVHSFATSGIQFTPAQVRIMAKTFKRIAVCYDGESETSQELAAYEQATTLISELKFRGVDAFRVTIKGDPGSIEQEEANYLVKQLIK
jgi:hypothetical protein